MTTMTLQATTLDAATRRHSAARMRRPVRLTRRGRLFVVLSALATLFVGVSLGQVSSQATPHAAHYRPTTVTVAPGESLWSLATRVAPHTDPRLEVTQIERLNHLSSDSLFAGQQLVVPR